jgi:hypothetical protein
LADVVDPAVKYGGGPEALQSRLLSLSDTVGKMEVIEARILATGTRSEIDAEFNETKMEFKHLLETLIEQGYLWHHEVVLLEAASEDALHKTHGRYFEDVDGLLALAGV